MTFIPNQRIEAKAHHRLNDLARFCGGPISYPVDVDCIAEQIFGLKLLWDEIEEMYGETILAGLQAHEKLIVFNERHRGLFEDKPGLYRMTLGHELGHWDLYPVPSEEQRTLDVAEVSPKSFYRQSPRGQLALPVEFIHSAPGREFILKLRSRSDSPQELVTVNRYAAALLMPEGEVRARISVIDRTSWPELYKLAVYFGVTISALVVRLQQLKLIFVEQDGRIYENRQEAAGQGSLFRR